MTAIADWRRNGWRRATRFHRTDVGCSVARPEFCVCGNEIGFAKSPGGPCFEIIHHFFGSGIGCGDDHVYVTGADVQRVDQPVAVLRDFCDCPGDHFTLL